MDTTVRDDIPVLCDQEDSYQHGSSSVWL